jgi:predicted nuclease of predicted toxin-antitoxin system
VAVSFYFDHNVDRAVVHGLRLRGVDVLTAFEDGTHKARDVALIDRALALGRVLFSTDVDFLVEARRRQREGQPFAGVVFARQSQVGIGAQIEDLELIAKAANLDDLANGVLYLPIT